MIDTLLTPGKGADLVLTGGQIINTITREIYEADLAIMDGRILMAGDAKDLIGEKTTVVDLQGMYISPGFIDSHMHFESSMLTITEFTRLSLPSGTTTLIADPHEIGNALGPVGMKAMADEALRMPQYVRLVVPALAPDCPLLETPGVNVDSRDMEDLLNYPGIVGIGELQGFSLARHVYEKTPEVVDDLLSSTAYARSIGQTVDGNAPDLFGEELAAHILATGGWCSCHETTTKEECVEKLRMGVHVFMREGSTQKNMAECIRAVTEEGMDSRRCILATDDMLAGDLMELGHMNDIVRRTIRQGVDPVEAIQMVTSNPAAYWGFKDRGVIAPGAVADLAIISDLEDMQVEAVFLSGKLVAKGGKLLIPLPVYTYLESVKHSVKRGPVTEDELSIIAEQGAAAGGSGHSFGGHSSASGTVTGRCIVAIQDQNLTDTSEVSLKVGRGGIVECDPAQDVVYMVNVGRYESNLGQVGKCFVTGFGMKAGAMAESVGHDTHNIMAAGTNLKDLSAAINRVIEMGGGLALAKDGRVLDGMALPVGGLITDELTGFEVSEKMKGLELLAKEQLGVTLPAPFMHLSFLALSTSPKWKLTDRGLVDVDNFEVLEPIV